MVIALVALLLGSLMIAGLLKTVSMSHRQLKRDEFRMQASLLADAGCARALALLQIRPDFTEETWNVSGEQLPYGRSAVVRMKISTDAADVSKRFVSVLAEYPLGHPDLVKISREVAIR